MAGAIVRDPLATSLPGVRGIHLGPAELARQSLPELGKTLDRCADEAQAWTEAGGGDLEEGDEGDEG